MAAARPCATQPPSPCPTIEYLSQANLAATAAASATSSSNKYVDLCPDWPWPAASRAITHVAPASRSSGARRSKEPALSFQPARRSGGGTAWFLRLRPQRKQSARGY